MTGWTIENWIGASGLAVTVAILIFNAGRWSKKFESIGSLFKREMKNGNGHSVDELLNRVGSIESQMFELNTQLRIMSAERSQLIVSNQREHDEFRQYIGAITRRIDSLMEGRA